jgi:hypothetical protein
MVDIMQVNKDLLPFDKPEIDDKTFQGIESKLYNLKKEFGSYYTSLDTSPVEIEAHFYSHASRQTGCIWGAVGATLGTIGFFTWSMCELVDSVDEYSQNHSRKEKVKNYI